MARRERTLMGKKKDKPAKDRKPDLVEVYPVQTFEVYDPNLARTVATFGIKDDADVYAEALNRMLQRHTLREVLRHDMERQQSVLKEQ